MSLFQNTCSARGSLLCSLQLHRAGTLLSAPVLLPAVPSSPLAFWLPLSQPVRDQGSICCQGDAAGNVAEQVGGSQSPRLSCPLRTLNSLTPAPRPPLSPPAGGCPPHSRGLPALPASKDSGRTLQTPQTLIMAYARQTAAGRGPWTRQHAIAADTTTNTCDREKM